MNKRKVLRVINILLVVYIIIGVVLYYFQDKLILSPELADADSPYTLSQKHNEVNIALNANENLNIIQYLPEEGTPKGVVLYFHGNKGNASHYAAAAKMFKDNGFEVWVPDYPGYGKTSGSFTEERVYSDALQVYTLASSRFSADNIYIYGWSLGTGAASWLATKKSSKHVILEAPFYNLPSIAQRRVIVYPASSLVKYKFPVYKNIPLINAPVTILHGTKDKVIPYQNARKLQAVLSLPKDQFVTIENGEHWLEETAAYKQIIEKIIATP